MKFLKLVFIFLIFFFFLPKKTFAVSVTVTNAPSAVFEDPFDITVQVSGGKANATNFLRISLYKNGTTQYFGYTYNGTDWHNDSDGTNYFPITIGSDGKWSGTLRGKIDSLSKYYTGSGSYGLKVRRYTSKDYYTWSNENLLTIDAPTPTPTPSATPSQTPSSTPTSTPRQTSTPIKQATSSVSSSIPIGTKAGADFISGVSQSSVLGTNSALATPKNEKVETMASSETNLPKIFLVVGFIIILASIGVYLRQRWIKQ